MAPPRKPKKAAKKSAAKKPPAKPSDAKRTASAERGRAAGDINWPIDADGQPMAKITFSCSDKVPTGNYANVNIGPATASRFVPDDDDAISGGLTRLAEIVETVVGAERVNVLKAIQDSADES